ncbi:hypothetical protein K250101E9_50990 [Enterocloster aldenensis]
MYPGIEKSRYGTSVFCHNIHRAWAVTVRTTGFHYRNRKKAYVDAPYGPQYNIRYI